MSDRSALVFLLDDVAGRGIDVHFFLPALAGYLDLERID